MSSAYEIRYAEEAVADLCALRMYDQRIVLEAIESHLSHQPEAVSKSRSKEMEQPFWSQYRLRVGGFRVYYDVDRKQRVVYVLRVLEKGTEPTRESHR